MKRSAFAFVTALAVTPALFSTAHAIDPPRTGTAFEVAQQYASGGEFGGITSGRTGTTLAIARDSLSFPGSPDRIASNWQAAPIMAKGE